MNHFKMNDIDNKAFWMEEQKINIKKTKKLLQKITEPETSDNKISQTF